MSASASGAAAEARLDGRIESTRFKGLRGSDRELIDVAEQRIELALRRETTCLDLNDLSLATLPDVIGDCVAIEEFNCSHNYLSKLPNSLENCVALRYLCCSENYLTILPNMFGKMTALEYLICYENRITNLPDSLGNCVALRGLDCSDNKLASLPDIFGAMTTLENFNCECNKLTALPDSLGNCPNLPYLECDNNPWGEAWLNLQELTSGDNPTMKTLKALAEKLAQRRVKAATVNS